MLSRRGEQAVAELRALEENRICGLVTDEDYLRQRAEKFRTLTRPVPGMWLAALLGVPLLGVPAGALIWLLTHDEPCAFAIAVLAGAWGILSIGRVLQEECTELCSRGRRKILVALLDNDLLTASEFAEHEQRLIRGS
ncbi:hypothetical protein LBMAG57_08860 [Verrucomicrobiota bacterium]|jgi:hypothetical protein|nr:hypothetical protein LBMAG57_08860 [Verrucomicrobiota bacterium]